MLDINRKFAQALAGKVQQSPGWTGPVPDECTSPARARQAGVGEDVALAAAAEALGLPFFDSLTDRPISHEFLSAVPIAFARHHGLIGLRDGEGTVQVALSDLSQWPALQVLGRMVAQRIEPAFAPRAEILKAINAAYQQQSGQAHNLIEELDTEQDADQVKTLGNEDLLDVSSRAPVIKLVNLILLESIKRNASDVHIQPEADKLVVRFRIDGILQDVFEPPRALQPEIVSRIKIMGGMNIAEHRLAQDGRATVEVGDRVVDLRISTLPTSFGERAVIRLLDKSTRLFKLEDLGFPADDLANFRKFINMDHGIILVTGPTGSGKTTTLYGALQEINSQELNILTLEDPIEYRLDGISQTQVATRKGMTFATGLRSVLRQDPDIIMVGEIRDAETAKMAIQSALTGHLVFSTLHTNDAAGAVARMLDLEVEPYLLASSLLGVLAQRLVRQICPSCRVPYEPTPRDLVAWNLAEGELPERKFFRGAGCPACQGTGSRGRLGVFELLTVNEEIRERILQHERATGIKALAIAGGMTSLRAAGLAKVAAGITTMDEVARVTSRDET
jgi:general secretion pathway protein E